MRTSRFHVNLCKLRRISHPDVKNGIQPRTTVCGVADQSVRPDLWNSGRKLDSRAQRIRGDFGIDRRFSASMSSGQGPFFGHGPHIADQTLLVMYEKLRDWLDDRRMNVEVLLGTDGAFLLHRTYPATEEPRR